MHSPSIVAPQPGGHPQVDTTILLVIEHALIRAALRALLGGTRGFAIVPDARDLHEAVALARQFHPAVVLVDALPRDEPARVAFARIRSETPGVCVLVLGHADKRAEGADAALPGQAGPAFSCIPHHAGVEEFCAAVGSLLGGACAACALRPQCPVPQLAALLSRRERQVAVSVAAGLSSKQIAGALGIGVRTVNTYREGLARKVGASSGAVLTRYVIESGLDAAWDPQRAPEQV